MCRVLGKERTEFWGGQCRAPLAGVGPGYDRTPSYLGSSQTVYIPPTGAGEQRPRLGGSLGRGSQRTLAAAPCRFGGKAVCGLRRDPAAVGGLVYRSRLVRGHVGSGRGLDTCPRSNPVPQRRLEGSGTCFLRHDPAPVALPGCVPGVFGGIKHVRGSNVSAVECSETAAVFDSSSLWCQLGECLTPRNMLLRISCRLDSVHRGFTSSASTNHRHTENYGRRDGTPPFPGLQEGGLQRRALRVQGCPSRHAIPVPKVPQQAEVLRRLQAALHQLPEAQAARTRALRVPTQAPGGSPLPVRIDTTRFYTCACTSQSDHIQRFT